MYMGCLTWSPMRAHLNTPRRHVMYKERIVNRTAHGRCNEPTGPEPWFLQPFRAAGAGHEINHGFRRFSLEINRCFGHVQ
jgi:hypothetical protein